MNGIPKENGFFRFALTQIPLHPNDWAEVHLEATIWTVQTWTENQNWTESGGLPVAVGLMFTIGRPIR